MSQKVGKLTSFVMLVYEGLIAELKTPGVALYSFSVSIVLGLIGTAYQAIQVVRNGGNPISVLRIAGYAGLIGGFFLALGVISRMVEANWRHRTKP